MTLFEKIPSGPRQSRPLVFVGPLGGGQAPWHGSAFKNLLLLRRLRELGFDVRALDTEAESRGPLRRPRLLRPLRLLRSLAPRLRPGRASFIVAASRRSALRLCRLLAMMPRSQVHYWVIGGRLAEDAAGSSRLAATLRRLSSIVVEADTMARPLASLGLRNVRVIPNFKTLPLLPCKPSQQAPGAEGKPKAGVPDAGIHVAFVFLGRISPHKGVREIFRAAALLRELRKPRHDAGFSIDFYGHVEPGFEEDFDRLLCEAQKSNLSIRWLGLLDMTRADSYRRLSSYQAMLLPSYWESEGFPGSAVDAWAAALPVVASRWMSLPEIIADGHTGLLVEPRDPLDLARAMRRLIEDPALLARMSREALRAAPAFDSRAVITPKSTDFLHLNR